MTTTRRTAHRFHLWMPVLAGIGMAAWMIGVWFGTGFSGLAVTPEPIDRPHAAGSPAALAEEHGCWTEGEAPTIPGHVVVTLPGEAEPTYAGAVVTGKALDQLFAGKDYGMTVHAFCP